MQLATYTPFDLQIDRFLNDALSTVVRPIRTWAPACNVYEDADGFHVEAALPGMSAKDIEIVAEDGVLTIKGERKEEAVEPERTYLVRELGRGSFSRSFAIPTHVDHNKASATYRDGVLFVQLPKLEEAKPRRIVIETK
ncbi:MAG: Hsp20/alpha crystallin family protein [Nitrospirota bacterium]